MQSLHPDLFILQIKRFWFGLVWLLVWLVWFSAGVEKWKRPWGKVKQIQINFYGMREPFKSVSQLPFSGRLAGLRLSVLTRLFPSGKAGEAPRS